MATEWLKGEIISANVLLCTQVNKTMDFLKKLSTYIFQSSEEKQDYKECNRNNNSLKG